MTPHDLQPISTEPPDASRGDVTCFCPADKTRALLEKYGSPLFFLSEDRLRQNFRALNKAFSRGGMATSVHYSFKTNYLPALCAILADEGAGAEVVSGLEYRLARKLGLSGEEILFGGPFKTRDEIETAIGQRALIIVDGFDELAAIARAAQDTRQRARLGLRIRFGDGDQDNQWSRFGFAENMGEAQKAFEIIARNDALDLCMLHAHEGTFCNTPDVYGQRTLKLCRLAALARRANLAPTMINIGGGFPDPYDLGAYGEAVMAAMEENPDAFGPTPSLVLEPGRALVDTAMELAATVVSVKTSQSGQSLVTLDAGVHLLPPACRPYPRPLIAPDRKNQPRRETAVFGPLCMPEDTLDDAARLPALSPGDLVVIKEAGAYTISQTMAFIRSRPAVVLLEKNGEKLIRRREEDADFFALDLDLP